MKKDKERGAIVVEATIALTAFIFAIFTILSIVNIYFIQARVSVALNGAAKEISQYSYLYYKLNVNKVDERLSDGTEKYRATTQQTIDGIDALVDSMSGTDNGSDTSNFDDLVGAIRANKEPMKSLVTTYAEHLKNPKEFIIGMGKMLANEAYGELKSFLAQIIAPAFMEKNLQAFSGDSADAFLRRYKVVDGMDGLDFDGSSMLTNGENQLQLVVTYDVEVIKLLNIDFKFTFRQSAQATLWGNGVSVASSDE